MKLISILFMFPFAIFHGDLDLRIQEKTLEIQSNPSNGDLYIARGKLYFQHEEYDKSIKDFQVSRHLNSHQEQIWYYLSRSFYCNKDLDSASYYIEQYFNEIEPDQNPKAVQLHGKILIETGHHCDAARKFELLLSLSKKTIPKHYIDAADAHIRCESDDSIEMAVDCLNRGITALGPLYVLHKRLVSVYLKANDFDSAIRQQTIIVESSKRKEKSLTQRAKIRFLADQPKEALRDLDQALDAILKLPGHTGNNKAMQNLRRVILDLKRETERTTK